MLDELLTYEELAQRLKVKSSTVKAWTKARRIPAVRVGAKIIRFDYVEVVEALRAGQDKGSASSD